MASTVNDDVSMEIEMLRAIAGDDNVQDPAQTEANHKSEIPTSMKGMPTLRMLISREPGVVAPDLILWMGFPSASYPGADASCVPLIKIELDPSAPIRHRPEEFEKEAKATALAEAGQMCINQVYQRCVDLLAEFEQQRDKAAHSAAAAAAESSAVKDPTIRVGTQLTVESFKAWKVEFEADRAKKAAKEAALRARESANKSRLTGKQMWDTTLKSADWKLFEKAADGTGDAGADDDDYEDVDYVFGDESGDDAAEGKEGEEDEEDEEYEELEEDEEEEEEEEEDA